MRIIENFVWLPVLVWGCYQDSLVVLVIALTAYLVRGFVADGSELTLAGGFRFACLVFICIAAFYAILDPEYSWRAESVRPFLVACTISIFLALVTYSAIAERRPRVRWNTEITAAFSAVPRPPLLIAATFLMATGAATSALLPDAYSELAGQSAFVVITALIPAAIPISALWAATSKSRLWWIRLLLPAAGVILYWSFVFTGFGRITILALVVCGVAVLSWARPSWVWKAVLLVATPFGLVQGFAVETDTGLTRGSGSLVSPLWDGAATLDFAGTPILPYAKGETYLANLVSWVPRSVWPDKPLGLGSTAVQWISPRQFGTGHSVAVTYVGEFVYNFGWLGVVLGSVALGAMLGFGDRYAFRTVARFRQGIWPICAFVTYVLLLSAQLDFVWAGTNAPVQRYGPRIFVAVLAVWSANSIWQLVVRPHSRGGATTAPQLDVLGREKPVSAGDVYRVSREGKLVPRR